MPSADSGKTVSMTINKQWRGDAGHESKRPTQLDVVIRNNQTGRNVRIVTLSAGQNWTTTVNGLPYIKDSEGHLDYSVSETTVPDGYEQSSSIMTNQTKKDLELWTLANGLDNNSLNGKSFVILNGNSGDVQLLRAEGPTNGVMTATQHVLTDPLTVNGKTYNSYGYIGKGTDGYTVEQSLGWTALSQGGGYVLRSNMLENDPTLHRTAYLTVDKKGAYKLATDIKKATVFKYDTAGGSLNANNTTLYPYQHTDQGQMDDYVSTVTITNTYEGSNPSGPEITVGDGPVTVNASKQWADDNDSAHARPKSVTVNVLADGRPVKDDKGMDVAITLNASNKWKGSVTGLPRYGADGKEITYTLKEQDLPDGYTAAETGRTSSTDTTYYWVQAKTFGESAKDNDQYLVVAQDIDNRSQWLGMHVKGSKVSWTNKEGHSARVVAINNQKITVNGVTYDSWIPQNVVDQHKDALWNSHYVGDLGNGQSGTNPDGSLIIYHKFRPRKHDQSGPMRESQRTGRSHRLQRQSGRSGREMDGSGGIMAPLRHSIDREEGDPQQSQGGMAIRHGQHETLLSAEQQPHRRRQRAAGVGHAHLQEGAGRTQDREHRTHQHLHEGNHRQRVPAQGGRERPGSFRRTIHPLLDRRQRCPLPT